jgi:hypothetical protein
VIRAIRRRLLLRRWRRVLRRNSWRLAEKHNNGQETWARKTRECVITPIEKNPVVNTRGALLEAEISSPYTTSVTLAYDTMTLRVITA